MMDHISFGYKDFIASVRACGDQELYCMDCPLMKHAKASKKNCTAFIADTMELMQEDIDRLSHALKAARVENVLLHDFLQEMFD